MREPQKQAKVSIQVRVACKKRRATLVKSENQTNLWEKRKTKINAIIARSPSPETPRFSTGRTLGMGILWFEQIATTRLFT
jgi:hypothetical protein